MLKELNWAKQMMIDNMRCETKVELPRVPKTQIRKQQNLKCRLVAHRAEYELQDSWTVARCGVYWSFARDDRSTTSRCPVHQCINFSCASSCLSFLRFPSSPPCSFLFFCCLRFFDEASGSRLELESLPLLLLRWTTGMEVAVTIIARTWRWKRSKSLSFLHVIAALEKKVSDLATPFTCTGCRRAQNPCKLDESKEAFDRRIDAPTSGIATAATSASSQSIYGSYPFVPNTMCL